MLFYLDFIWPTFSLSFPPLVVILPPKANWTLKVQDFVRLGLPKGMRHVSESSDEYLIDLKFLSAKVRHLVEYNFNATACVITEEN